ATAAVYGRAARTLAVAGRAPLRGDRARRAERRRDGTEGGDDVGRERTGAAFYVVGDPLRRARVVRRQARGREALPPGQSDAPPRLRRRAERRSHRGEPAISSVAPTSRPHR